MYCVITSNNLSFCFKSLSKKTSHSKNFCRNLHPSPSQAPALPAFISQLVLIVLDHQASFSPLTQVLRPYTGPLNPDLTATSVSSLDFGHPDLPRSTLPWLPSLPTADTFSFLHAHLFLYVCLYLYIHKLHKIRKISSPHPTVEKGVHAVKSVHDNILMQLPVHA